MTRIDASGSPSASAIAVRTLNGTWVEDHTVSRPLCASVRRQDRAPLDRHAGDAGVGQAGLDDDIGLGESRGRHRRPRSR